MGWWPFSRKRGNDRSIPSIPSAPAAPAAAAAIEKTKQFPDPSVDQAQHEPTPQQSIEKESVEQISARSSGRQPHVLAGEDASASNRHNREERYPHLETLAVADSSGVPSSGAKRSAAESALVRRRSSKKRKSLHQEDQTKSLGSSASVLNKLGSSIGSVRGTKQRSGMKQHLHPQSTYSSGKAHSTRPSTMGITNGYFDVGALDILSPRPTLRFSAPDQFASDVPNASASSRGLSTSGKRPATERNLPVSKTIDDLADDLDPGGLREIMERDKRRRDRRRKAEEDRARRRLDRHAARDQAEETTRPSARSLTRTADIHPAFRNHPPMPGEKAEAGPSTLFMRSPITQHMLMRPAGLTDRVYTGEIEQVAQNPFQDPEPVPSTAGAPSERSFVAEISSPFEDPIVGTAQTIRYSQASMSPPASPPQYGHGRNISNISQITDMRSRSTHDLTSETTPSNRRGSEPTNRLAGPLAVLFRRGKRDSEERGRGDHSEASFSNTSRESMPRQQPPAHLRELVVAPTNSRSTTPLRTKSKFREELEMPISPPSSRINSPIMHETETLARPRIDTHMLEPVDTLTDSVSSTAPGSAAAMSHSLASVDSEASWLAGNHRRRASAAKRPGDATSSYERLASREEQSLPRPDTGTKEAPRTRLGAIRAALSVDEFDEGSRPVTPEHAGADEQVVHGDVSRMPTVVHRQARVKSNEGLLNQFLPERPLTPPAGRPDTAESPVEHDSPQLARATYGQHHARQVSAGSARLLEIPARRDSTRSNSMSPRPVSGQWASADMGASEPNSPRLSGGYYGRFGASGQASPRPMSGLYSVPDSPT